MEVKTILVLDDEEVILDFIDTAFTSDDDLTLHKTYLVKTANEAIDIVAKNKIHLVISDIHLPGRDGIFFTKELWRISPKTKIILTSGIETLESLRNKIDFEEFNVLAFLQKPINRQELLRHVKQSL